MIIQSVWQKAFDFFDEKPVVVEPAAAQISSDAGLLPIRQFDERVGLTARFAAALFDPRSQPSVRHPFVEMVRSRIYGILAGYPDQNDHDGLRFDPIFKLIAGRSPDDAELACQTTLSRFENAVDIASFWRLRDWLIDQFIASFEQPPGHLTLDVDVFDDPTHGQQQLTFFHGYYDQYQYLPRAITCAENDLVVSVALLYGTAHPALGLEDDLEYLVRRLRAAWPDVRIHLRGDSGFGVPRVYDACERLDLSFTCGQKLNPVLQNRSDSLLKQAIEQYEKTGQPQRLFTAFWYQAGSWPRPRWTIVKAEAHAQGTNRRAVVSNRAGAFVLPGSTYDEYAERGESENRNKELKRGLQADRLSDHRFLANYFRLYLHTAAYNLLARLRNHVADPPGEDPHGEVPHEALGGCQRRRYFNRRREQDPLGQGQPGTWQTRLIKVAAEIFVRSRRILVRLSGSWPYLEHYRHVSQQVLEFSAPPLAEPG